LFGLCRDDFWHIFLIFSVNESEKYISNYLIAAKWEIQRGHGEGKTYCTLLDRMEMADICWMPYEKHREIQEFRRYFGIPAGSCAVLRRCTVTFLGKLNSSTDTCKTSLDLRQMFFLCGILRMCRLPSTFLFTPLRKIVGVSRQEICHGGMRMYIPYGTDECLALRFLPPIPRSPPRPANEEQIIAHQRQQHQERGSSDTYDMVSGVVFQVDDYLGQEGMSNEKLYAALCHVREKLA